MSIQAILSAFGGGIFGAAIGGLPAFIFTGFIGLIGIAVLASGGSPTILNDIAFGSLFGPHIAFAGGVAAAAYAANKKNYLGNGTDISTSLNKFGDPMVLIVGGVFGVLGFLLNNMFVSMNLKLDTPGLTVFVLGVLTRILFGETGIFGEKKDSNGEKRRILIDSKTLLFDIVLGAGLGFVISYLVILTQINVLGFCISAALLIFAQMGFGVPTTHHISMVAGYAAIATGNIWIATAFAVLASIVGELAGSVFNTNCDSHIDPPATTIFICSAIIFALF